jgi:hypothetical protein
MRMSKYDMLMAIARKSEYIEDHKKISEHFDELMNTINTLCKPGQNPPNAMIYESQVALQDLCSKVCKKWNLRQLIRPYSAKYKSVDENSLSINRIEAIEEVTEDQFHQLIGNRKPLPAESTGLINPHTRFVTIRLKIDMARSEGELLSAFSEKITTWKKHIPKQVRKRKTIYDPWDIYDQKESGLSFLEIARRLSGEDYPRGERTPSYNEELWNPYKRVQRAYNQAVKMFQTVKPL